MKKKPAFDTSFAEDHLAHVEENNRKMREKANPLVRGMMDEVQSAIDDENALMKARFEAENKLRTWAETLCGVKLDMSEIETLRDLANALNKGQVVNFTPARKKDGTTVTVSLYKTVFGTIDRLENYIYALEKTITDLSNKPQQNISIAGSVKDPYTGMSFCGLIKLAFKQLFKGAKKNHG